MLSYDYIQAESQKAAKKAARQDKKPASIKNYVPGEVAAFCKRIPFLGSYVPEGWVEAEGIEDLFVDSSGFGEDNEPALSLPRFDAKLQAYKKSGDNFGFGIVEAGQFQVVIRVYRPNPRDFTNTGELTRADLARIGQQ